jgi:hypothetical protein
VNPETKFIGNQSTLFKSKIFIKDSINTKVSYQHIWQFYLVGFVEVLDKEIMALVFEVLLRKLNFIFENNINIGLVGKLAIIGRINFLLLFVDHNG